LEAKKGAWQKSGLEDGKAGREREIYIYIEYIHK
jgi:hypothetical protein